MEVKLTNKLKLKKTINVAKQIDEIANSISPFVNDIKPHLSKLSPVLSGTFSKEWNVGLVKGQNKLSIKMYNETPYYEAVNFGSVLGNKPWPNPGSYTVLELPTDGDPNSTARVFSSRARVGVTSSLMNQTFMNNLANIVADAFQKTLFEK